MEMAGSFNTLVHLPDYTILHPRKLYSEEKTLISYYCILLLTLSVYSVDHSCISDNITVWLAQVTRDSQHDCHQEQWLPLKQAWPPWTKDSSQCLSKLQKYFASLQRMTPNYNSFTNKCEESNYETYRFPIHTSQKYLIFKLKNAWLKTI